MKNMIMLSWNLLTSMLSLMTLGVLECFFMLKDDQELKFFFKHYGLDLLLNSIDYENIFLTFQKKNVSLKQILLDQKVFVGIGNIYANEALFHCRLHPERKSNTLTKVEIKQLIRSCRHVLELSLKNGGSFY